MKHFGCTLREESNLENRLWHEVNTKMDLTRKCKEMNLTRLNNAGVQ
jgi:hypothetical protein